MNNERKRKYMYGKFHHDTYEFHKEIHALFNDVLQRYKFEMNANNAIVELRNKVVALLDSWIGAKKFEEKFGIKLPLSAVPPSIQSFLERQAGSRSLTYKPCEICGEDRITHYCHIIPHSEGGPNAEENYLYLCPTHHHLFDHHRLSKEEWERIEGRFSTKLPSSMEYMEKFRLPMLQKFWEKR